MEKHTPKRHLADAYRFSGFHTAQTVAGIFGDPKARLLAFSRRSKKRFVAVAGRLILAGMTISPGVFVICRAETRVFTWFLIFAAWIVGVVGR